VSEATVAGVRGALPELPAAKEARFVSQYRLPAYDAALLTSSRDIAQYYEDVVGAGADPKAASNWVMGEVMAWINERNSNIGVLSQRIAPSTLAEIISLQASGRLSSSAAKSVFTERAKRVEVTIHDQSGGSVSSVEVIVKELGLEQVSDTSAIEADARAVLDENPEEVARYLAGKEQLLQFFVGQLMKRTKGKANPKVATDAIKGLLDSKRAG
jgi:aspartyl-tRNA(Asn)/glutamyl-tRNA(Gln) amidotransferase subunit B